MLATYFWVGVAFAVPELVIVNNIPSLRLYLKRNPIAELIFSLGLGVLFGLAVGITGGVTFIIGNIFATVITKVVYALDLMEKWKVLRAATIRFVASTKRKWNEFNALITVIWRIISLPFVIVFKSLRWLNEMSSKFQSNNASSTRTPTPANSPRRTQS